MDAFWRYFVLLPIFVGCLVIMVVYSAPVGGLLLFGCAIASWIFEDHAIENREKSHGYE